MLSVKDILRKTALVMSAAILMTSSASAMEIIDNQEGNLHVVGCEEWISLRSVPSMMEGEVLAQIPLGQLVRHIDDLELLNEISIRGPFPASDEFVKSADKSASLLGWQSPR
ncbi:MAG: hypothetical protein IJU00_00520 [Selenomonas sp.]|nr:hypothetical protein [Selenomonas sp.]